MAEEHHEVIIVKHHGDHEEGHHGGAWKIAFADFMTAMMALFLVLWLISATNPKMRIVIARYFNPVKLADVSSDKKGLNDPSSGESSSHSNGSSGESSEKHFELPPATEKRALYNRNGITRDEAALFRDPYAVLSEISGQPTPSDGTLPAENKGASKVPMAAATPSTSIENDESFRDPFATVPTVQQSPDSSQQSANTGDETIDKNGKGPGAGGAASVSGLAPTDGAALVGKGPESGVASTMTPAQNPPAGEALKAEAPKPDGKADKAEAIKAEAAAMLAPGKDVAKDASKAPKAADKPVDAKQSALADAVQAKGQAAASGKAESEGGKLRSEIAALFGKDLGNAATPNVEVKTTDEGVLISLTDEASYAMFSIGSAEPKPKTIEAMEKVAQLLKKHDGMIVVRGHTDGRPYKGTNYDNWQLSSARAQMAHYMLVRGGLDEKRIDRIEGYADHQLKIANDPLAAENRRIEILLKKDK